MTPANAQWPDRMDQRWSWATRRCLGLALTRSGNIENATRMTQSAAKVTSC
jgi:hypothetical protein